VENNLLIFGVFADFATGKNVFQKSKCVHHSRTRRHLCAKFDVLRLLSPEISFGEITVTHPDTQLVLLPVNLTAEKETREI